MKFTAIILLAACLQVSASGFSQGITLSEKDAPLEVIIKEIKSQSGYGFVYTRQMLKMAKRVTVRVENVTLEKALDECLKEQSLTYSILDNTVVIKVKNSPAPVLQAGDTSLHPHPLMEVHGQVRNENGQPSAGATIRVKGSERMTITGEDGQFTLTNAAKGISLIVTAVNIETLEVPARAFMNIIVKTRVTTAGEVVVTVNTGYQNISRERSAGSFAKVEGEEIRGKSASMNVIDRVEGLVPGLAVNYGQGADKLLLRGVTSVNASRLPLFVLDGVPIENTSQNPDVTRLINPDDVESITFLKDATAASIWGAQAANGVIVITSKKGRATNRKIKVSYNGFVSLRGLPDYNYLKLMNSSQLVSSARSIFDPATFSWSQVNAPVPGVGDAVVYPHEMPLYDHYRGLIDQATMDSRLDSLSSLNNRHDIDHYLLQPALLSNHSLSFTGGNIFHTYYGSIAYTRQQDNNKGSLDRYQINFRQDFSFSDAIHADVTVNLSKEDTTAFIIPNLPELSTYLPYELFVDGAGHHLSQAHLLRTDAVRQNAETDSRLNLDYIPLDEASYASSNKSSTTTSRVNAGVTVKLLKGLQYEGRAQYLKGDGNAYVFYDERSYQVRNELVYFTQKPATPGGTPTYFLPVKGGQYRTSQSIEQAWTLRNQLTYDNGWGDHQLTALAGTEIRDSKNDLNNTVLRGFDFQTLNYQVYDEKTLATAGVTDPVLTTGYGNNNVLGSNPLVLTEKEYRYFSFYGNAAYAYKRKYDLNGSIRMDQSNLFGTDKSQQYKPIWSLGASWRISSEPFMQSFKKLDLLRLRLTYGLAGNSPNPGDGGPYDILQAYNIPFYAQYGTAYTILTPANSHLIWERTATTNLGIDFGLFNSRLSGSLDLYNKKTTDLLGFQPLDPTAGWYEGYSNLGELSNKGIELQLRSVNIRQKYFSWTTLINLSYNRNKVVELKSAIPVDPFGKSAGGFVEGYPSYSLFGFHWAGLDRQGDPQIRTAKGQVTKLSTDLALEDSYYKGATQPSWYGGITNSFSYKNFDASFLIIYNFGYVMRRDVNQLFTGRIRNNIPVYFLDRWQQPGDEKKTNVPSYVASEGEDMGRRYDDFYTKADINVVSAAYARLRDLTFGYSFSSRLAGKLSLEKLRIYGQVNNILLWRNNSYGIDPEYFNLPGGNRSVRMKPFLTLGLNVGFK